MSELTGWAGLSLSGGSYISSAAGGHSFSGEAQDRLFGNLYEGEGTAAAVSRSEGALQ